MSNTAQHADNIASVSQAQQQIQNSILPVTQSEQVTLVNALDRLSADDIVAPINVPAFDNSAMDGYVFCASDLTSTTQLHIAGSAFAGHPYQHKVQQGQAIQIMTGAKIPVRCDTVLPQELAAFADDHTLDMRNTVVHAGQHRRRCGEDIKAGSIPISKGCKLGPAELGILASLGLSSVAVQRKLRVAIFSTGDELRSVGQSLNNEDEVSSIYDSNRLTLHGMLNRCNIEVLDLGVLADNPATLTSSLRHIAPQVDTIITSGGISGGAADHTKMALHNLGKVTTFSINMRPGRQLTFGNIDSTYLFGLPGNPVAVMVSFYFFVRPALQKLSGAQITMPTQFNAIATHRIPKKIGRTEFQRGNWTLSAQGEMCVSIVGKQGSGILSSMSHSNCFVILSQEQADIEAGDTVKIVLFEGLMA